MFIREDWSLFRTLGTLGQKAGVAVDVIPRLVAKELADNALDVAGTCEVGFREDNGFFVTDRGTGIPGSDEEVAALFSIARPLVSSKLLRLPTRGALGNGLRVVAGAVLATGGRLIVSTRGRVLELCPQDNGSTDFAVVGDYDQAGTRVDIVFGEALTVDDSLAWAGEAIRLAQGEGYRGKTSPYWYDGDAFFELLQAAQGRPVRDLVADLDGCSGAKAGKIAAAFLGRSCDSVTREEAEELLAVARQYAKPVAPRRLGSIGDCPHLPAAYAKAEGFFTLNAARGTLDAQIPAVVEAWVETPLHRKKKGEVGLQVTVNKTPITAPASARYNDSQIAIFGAGLQHYVADVGRIPPSRVVVNVQTPYMPITSDGKAPNLWPLYELISEAVEKATKRSKRDRRDNAPKSPNQKDVILQSVEAGRIAASSNGRYRFSQRQLFYSIRPIVIEATGKEPSYDHFTSVLTGYENTFGDIPGMYRDPRGIVYHPHLGETIQLGTLEVEAYRRPDWTFNKVLYIEKEGFFSILISEKWPERHDCALLTSKGQATRAAKDLIDQLGETDEELLFFCVHDADAAGTQIYQSLQEATASRPGRRVKIVNLGLDPWEALDMGLQVEQVTNSKRRQPVGDYVPRNWADWLQARRVELNAMTTDVFLAWLDRKMEEFGKGKVIPPEAVVKEEFGKAAGKHFRRLLTEEILREARLDDQVVAAVESLQAEGFAIFEPFAVVAQGLQEAPVKSWRDPLDDLAEDVVKNRLRLLEIAEGLGNE